MTGDGGAVCADRPRCVGLHAGPGSRIGPKPVEMASAPVPALVDVEPLRWIRDTALEVLLDSMQNSAARG